MPEQRRRGGGRRLTDLDTRLPQDLEAEDAYLDALEADAINDPALRGEEDPYALDHSYSRGGSAWPGSWGGA